MTQRTKGILDLDQFESDVLALLSELRLAEQTVCIEARQEAYVNAAKRYGFIT